MQTRLSGGEVVTGLTQADVRVLDFWQWAFSDLRQNDLRGVFAEWLVAKLLSLQLDVRTSWSGCDLVTEGGVRIEVKCGAYLQAWRLDGKLSPVTFGRLQARTWSPTTGYSPHRTRNADLYVFCVQTCCEPASWSALDLTQWRFHILTARQLEAFSFRSIGLTRLSKLARPLEAEEFRLEAKRLLTEVGPAT